MLLLVEVIAFALIAVTMSAHFGLTDGLTIMAAYLLAYLVPKVVLERARATSMGARVVLFVLAVALMTASCINLVEWTSPAGYDLEIPDLKNDARGFYKWALYHYDGRVMCDPIVFKGFPAMMLMMWKMLGVSVVWPQAMNMMFTLLAIVLTGMTTRRLLSHRVTMSPQALLTCGMLLCGLLTYYLMSGISILKEGGVYLSVSLAGYALSSMAARDEERHRLWGDLLAFALACVIMALVRTTYLYFIAVGVVLLGLPHWRRDWGMSLVFLAIIAVSLVIGNYFAAYSFEHHTHIADGGWDMQVTYIDGQEYNRAAFRKLIGYYFLYSPLHRVLMLPLTLSLQFVVPFPWNTGETQTIENALTRISYGWYLFGGIALFYYLFISWRRGQNMGIWAWWPATAYAVIAYVMAGSVTRYVLPLEPLFVPVVLFVICRLREGHWRRLFTRWSIFYVILLSLTLMVCLELHWGTFSRMFHTLPLTYYLKQYLPI